MGKSGLVKIFFWLFFVELLQLLDALLFFHEIWAMDVKLSPLHCLEKPRRNSTKWLSYGIFARGLFFLAHPVDYAANCVDVVWQDVASVYYTVYLILCWEYSVKFLKLCGRFLDFIIYTRGVKTFSPEGHFFYPKPPPILSCSIIIGLLHTASLWLTWISNKTSNYTANNGRLGHF